jgi:hypothetical protein
VRCFRVNLYPALALLDDAPDLACGPISAARQQLQRQVDRTANQTKPAHASPDPPTGEARSAPIFNLRFIGAV